MVTVQKGKHLPSFVEMQVRCRKCSACLRYRATLWRYRAEEEIRASQRTWMATLTLRPEAYVHLLSKVRVSAAKSAVTFEELSEDEQERRVHGQLYRDVQLWLKRLRKRTGKRFRFLAVTEHHESGVPHMHLLIHEQDQHLLYSELSGSWGLGFDKFKLVDGPRAAGYVVKYLAKELRSRVRASQFYGSNEERKKASLRGSERSEA